MQYELKSARLVVKDHMYWMDLKYFTWIKCSPKAIIPWMTSNQQMKPQKSDLKSDNHGKQGYYQQWNMDENVVNDITNVTPPHLGWEVPPLPIRDGKFLVWDGNFPAWDGNSPSGMGIPLSGMGTPPSGMGTFPSGMGTPRLGWGFFCLGWELPRLGWELPRLGCGLSHLGWGLPHLRWELRFLGWDLPHLGWGPSSEIGCFNLNETSFHNYVLFLLFYLNHSWQ